VEHGRPGETYCVGGRSEMKNLDVVLAVCDLLDQRVPAATPRRDLIRFVTDRPGHDHRYAIDPSKIERELGWRAQESFATGIARTVDWYLANDWWWRPLREQRYAGERLGLLPAKPQGTSGGTGH
jgi:dTDP-glucose 4,6-dehydratase